MQLEKNGLKHTMSTVMVFQSDEYNKFNMIRGNRQLDMVKIKKILADIDRGTNLLKYCPILVVEAGKKLDIVDGQHRFMVAKKIKSPVYYILAEKMSLYDIAKMNSNTEKWKAKDFINCYSELGNKNYIKLQKFMEAYPALPPTSAITLLGRDKVSGGGSSLIDAFRRGDFVVTSEENAYDLCNMADQFEFQHKFSRAFMQALTKVIEADVFPVEDLIRKVNSDPSQLKVQENYKKYLINLEEIASKGKHKRIQLY